MKKLHILILGLFISLTVNAGPCSSVPWTTWGWATPCVVGSGYYNNGCVVEYGGRNYEAKKGPHFDKTPAIGGTIYWNDLGVCGGSPPILPTTILDSDDCMFVTVTGETTSRNGGPAINERGFVWNTTGNPNITTDAARKVVYDNSNTLGTFQSILTVTENSQIYVKSYAINTDGDEGYGNQVNFTTDQSPTVTNVNAINIFCESMSFELSSFPNGQFFGSGVGTATNTEFGFIYGTNSALVDAATPSSYAGCSKEVHIARTGKGSSMSQIIRRSEITGLTPNTKYFYKSYTTTNVCTGYGPRKEATTDVACPVYYSCSGAATYDTDPACPDANLTPTAKSIVHFRHDWRLTPGTKLADLSGEIPSQPKIGITPYRIVIEQGGYAYATGSFNAGTQVVINTGGQFGYEGSPQLIVDGLPGAGLKFARLTMNGGSFVTSASLTNYTDISLGSGEICNDGSFANNADAPGSVYGNYTLGGGLTYIRYTDANCVGTFTLPVELLSFTVNRIDEYSVTYNWVTGSEINNDHFEIEVSPDGYNWEVISIIGGMGNITTITKYSHNEKTSSKYKYARLMQVDFDGTTSYSKIRNITIGSNDISVRAITNGFIVESDDSVDINVYDISGVNLLNTTSSGFNRFELSVPSGIYIVRVGNIAHKIFIRH